MRQPLNPFISSRLALFHHLHNTVFTLVCAPQFHFLNATNSSHTPIFTPPFTFPFPPAASLCAYLLTLCSSLYAELLLTLKDNPTEFELASVPLSKRDYHPFSFTSQYDIPDYEQSPPPSVRPSRLQQPTSIRYQNIHYEGQGPSRELVPYNGNNAAERRATMNRQPKRGYESVRDDDSESGV